MDRKLWNGRVTKYSSPLWPCPHCSRGVLKLVSDSLVHHETVASKRACRSDENYSEWDTDYRFAAWTECGHCKGSVSISGRGSLEQQYTSQEGDWEWFETFWAQIWDPMPDVFELPPKCPDNVRQVLRAAFALHAFDRASCASRLRVALELLMDSEKSPRKRRTVKGELRSLSLHERLNLYAADEPEIGPQLMALKWLGNAGSHESAVSSDDIFNAFEVFEHVLVEIVDKRKKRVKKLTTLLHRKFGKKRKNKPE